MELAEALETQAEERTQELDELLTNIVEYESKAVELDTWLSESIKTLKPKSGAPKPTKTKVEGLYEGKAEKDGEMETLRQMCGHLSEANGVKDKYALKELLADVETKWNDLTELLVQQVSLEVSLWLQMKSTNILLYIRNLLILYNIFYLRCFT
uniref:Uncharacterized protein n=1 Tax=Biomphalaria glabrata TaxID=6526 RepID=A0A2C9KXI0_BIOGL